MHVSRRHVLGVVGAAGSTGLAGCSTMGFGGDDPTPSPVSTPWPMFRHDPQNTAATDAPGPTAPVTEQWRVDPDGEYCCLDGLSPTVVGTTVYVGSSGRRGSERTHVYALSIADGSTQWRYDLDVDDDVTDTTPAVVDGTVYTAAFSPTTSRESMGAVSALAPVEETARWGFQVEDDFPWIRVRARNELWRSETPGPVASSPAVVDGTVYISSEDRRGHPLSGGADMYAFDARDGTLKWRAHSELPKSNIVAMSPAVADETVYIGTYGKHDEPNRIHALAAADGTEQWRYDLDDGRRPWAVAVANSTVYVSTRSSEHDVNTLYALAVDDGTERWTTQPVYSFPAVTDDTVYVGARGGAVHAYDTADGTQRWGNNIGAVRSSSPVVAGDTVYAYGSPEKSSGGPYIYALAVADGTQQWTFEGRVAEGSSPAVVDDTVYVIDSDSVYAITEA